MSLELPTLTPKRKNTQFRLCAEAIETVDRLVEKYEGHTRSSVVEAAILKVGAEELNGKGKK